MKTIYIIRHAKSSWKNDHLQDLDRPLTDRGKRDAILMGNLLKKLAILPSAVLSSPAVRAISTAHIICDEIAYSKNKIAMNNDLYFKEISAILELIQNGGALQDSICLFGHNTTLSNLVHAFVPQFTETMPTCAIAAIQFEVENWRLIEFNSGKLLFFEFPKKFRSK